ncbi:neural cell adhesion molecule 1b isoform X16 [Anguilla anguilla]|uniref:neural cell adhesion molecule 1b isoform X16 n=1 Tax=Anguilla anguilla TaxID=7936 RepID=UPI0015A9E260|nr:neural cell adhesion molecule 1b isoform X16 [Anguilla anguilla]
MLESKDLIWAFILFGTAVSLQVNIIPAQAEISVGESKFFLCEVVGDAKEIDWYWPSGEKILPNRQDVSVSRNDESSSTLIIYNAGIDNAGVYKCVARNEDKEAQATINLRIYQKLTFTSAPSPQEFNEGEDANIVCDVVSLPPPKVIWKHRGAKIQATKDVRFKILANNHLQIRGIKKTDEGSYTCEGLIMARGELSFRVIKVIVNIQPSIRVRQAEVNATADVGQSVTLACDVDGYPEPTVTWARDNVILESGDKYSFNDGGSKMTIKDAQKVDEGDYVCIAKNKAGSSEEEISLKVFVKPKITFLDNQTASELDEMVTLTCEATGDPTPSIVWSFGHRVFSEGEQASWTRPEKHKSLDGNVVVRSDARVSSLTLKYVQYTYGGEYLCSARNPMGTDAQAAYLEVRYTPKITGWVTVYTWDGNPANISCEVLAHPSASIAWFRDGQQLPSSNTTNVKIFSAPSVSYLEVTPDSQNDYGSYNCTASNALGTESKEFLLIQADVPSAPSVELVEPYSSTAQVEFEEPESSGGVPVLKYRAEWRVVGHTSWAQRAYEAKDGGLNRIFITGLRPDTQYEVKMSAINGKGEGESSEPYAFKTEPVREPTPPKLEGQLQARGNALKVNWIKQDDGGSPIKHYLVRYKTKEGAEWKPEIRLPSSSGYVVLSELDWDTEYEVYVVAENLQGKSQPGALSFRTSPEPTAIPDTDSSGFGMGAIAGILIVVFVLLLVAVDVTCYFINKCGLLMCIAVNVCGKSGPGAKAKDMEEGKAAFTADESKEPIVEVRTEEECTPNHDGGCPGEPNETTPLTEPDSPASESTTLTSSTATAAPVTAAKPAPSAPAPAPSAPAPQPSTPKANAPAAPSGAAPSVAPLVDLGDGPSAKPVANAKETPKAPPRRSAPNPSPAKPEAPKAKDRKEEAQAEAGAGPAKSPPEAAQNPAPAQNQDTRIDGADAHLSNDASLGKPTPDATAEAAAPPPTAAPAQDEKISVDEKSKPEETEGKTSVSEIRAVPNEAAQTNANESKA